MTVTWIRAWTLSGLAAISACSGDGQRVDLSVSTWSVSGDLTSKDGGILANRRIEIIRIQQVKGMLSRNKFEAKVFAIVKTDSFGKFFFETSFPGVYEVQVRGKAPCVTNVSLGQMKSESKSLKLVLDSKRCIFVM